jgi:peptidoglycan/xylan/chitin deacetylase (PgdA/CDA1 family)
MRSRLAVVFTMTLVAGCVTSAARFSGAPTNPPTAPLGLAQAAAARSSAVSLYSRWPLLAVGSAGSNVRAAKYLLRARGSSVLTDPTYRSATATVVKSFQRAKGISVTGTVDTATWRALFIVLRSGAKGDAVRGLQYLLWRNGFLGTVNGSYDATTLAAVRGAQQAFGLAVDGVAGSATWSALVSHYPSATVVRTGTTSAKVVALTFDAGSDLGHATQILDILQSRGIKATFGLTGAWVDAHPIVAKRIVTDGHEVVNHTYDHRSFTGFSTGTAPLTFTQRRDEIQRAWATIDATTAATFSLWFRPPYGDRDASVDRDAGALGYRRILMWTVDTLGWEGVPPAEVVQRCIDAARPGEIVLMHVGAASTDADALPTVIDQLQALGYAFGTASDVMG